MLERGQMETPRMLESFDPYPDRDPHSSMFMNLGSPHIMMQINFDQNIETLRLGHGAKGISCQWRPKCGWRLVEPINHMVILSLLDDLGMHSVFTGTLTGRLADCLRIGPYLGSYF